MSLLIFDLETTIYESQGRRANPFDSRNFIVACGYKDPRSCVEVYIDSSPILMLQYLFINNIKVLVGHNLKFDLLYLWKYESFQEWLKSGGKIWDTMLAEYIITGQETNLNSGKASLRYLATNCYLRPERSKYMEEYWEKGVSTENIPKEIIYQDLADDVLDTQALFTGQCKKVKELELKELIQIRMEALLSTIEMEFNGMYIDTQKASTNKQELKKELEQLDFELDMVATRILNKQYSGITAINFNSSSQLSTLFFGGDIRYFEGCTKLKDIKIQGLRIKPKKEWETKKEGTYSVNEAVLEELALNSKSKKARHLAQILLRRRTCAKLLNTYYGKMLDYIDPKTDCIHHQLNHTVTQTGRLTSSNPNLQQIPR